MKKVIGIFLFILSGSLFAGDVVEKPNDWCLENECTPKIKSIVDQFKISKNAPFIIPGMYSGNCYYLSNQMNPNTRHFIGLLFDYNLENKLYMAPVLQFFGESTDMADWSLEEARAEMSKEWMHYGLITKHSTSMTAQVVDDENLPVYTYWTRQNWLTKKVYFLVSMRGFGYGVCEAHLNKNGH